MENLRRIGFWWFGWAVGLLIGLATDWLWHGLAAGPVIIIPGAITVILVLVTLECLVDG